LIFAARVTFFTIETPSISHCCKLSRIKAGCRSGSGCHPSFGANPDLAADTGFNNPLVLRNKIGGLARGSRRWNAARPLPLLQK
jgi:hypothetical protein